MKRIAILLSMCIFLMMGFTAEGQGISTVSQLEMVES